MKFHIVQVNEKIKDISRKYNVSVDEIVKLNRHINNIENIIPGMKLRLPILSEEVSDQLKDNFLDIEKYYPKLEDFKAAKVEKKIIDEVEEDDDDNEPQETPQINVIPQPTPNQPVNPYQYNQPQQVAYQQQAYPNYPYQQQYPYYQQPVNQQMGMQNQPNPYGQMNMPYAGYQQPNYPQMNPYIMNRQNEQVTKTPENQAKQAENLTINFEPITKSEQTVKPLEKQEQNPNQQPINRPYQPVNQETEQKQNQQSIPSPYYQPIFPQINVPNQTVSYQPPIYPQLNEIKNEEKRKPYPFNEEIEQPKVIVDQKMGYENYPSINQPYYYQQMNSQMVPPTLAPQANTVVMETDEKVKEIKADLREMVRHTKIKKKVKDPLDLL